MRGNRIVAASEIIEKAAIAPNRNMWLQNASAMASRIASIPYIDTVVVHRVPRGTVSIVVTERAPFGVVETRDSRALVDRDLRVLRESDSNEALFMPVLSVRETLDLAPGTFVRDPLLRRLRDDEDALARRNVRPAVLTTDRFGQLVVTLRGGVRLLLGDDEDLESKLPLIVPILEQLKRAGKAVSVLDLRAPGTPIAVYKK
ncbi:MAG: FtsQ-type POTRA domain-containing protein [Candidatus Eremiobacteraeota bacterium]|nr:FtsQ-type POTRA domain-containing protein [Candidatus Eremiobacteraeota bacterium]